MLSERHKFIYLHVPKTGGNTVQTLLLPHSDDQKVFGGMRDGVERFEIKGPVTPRKHATLREYEALLGPELERFSILISVRHPFRRAVSAYFSPHRWYREDPDQGWIAREPVWDEAAFLDLLDTPMLTPASDFLRRGDGIKSPDVVIRTEALQDGVRRCEALLGLQGQLITQMRKTNATHAPKALYETVLSSQSLQQHVEAKFAADMDFFGYDTDRSR